MTPLIWIRNNKLTSLLIIIIFLLVVVKPLTGTRTFTAMERSSGVSLDKMTASDMAAPAMPEAGGGAEMMPIADYAPNPTATRMVISESNLSLLVKNVNETRDRILNLAAENGGYMVDASTQSPTEAPTGTVTIRVASDKLDSVLASLRGMAIKVVSENLHGYDVTDQYTDIEKNIAIYEATKTRYEAIMAQAVEVSDITQLTREIVNTQAQIDSLKGQQEYLKQNAKLARVTIFLSTDEIALPYAPSDAWRPEVIFKMAVRSLIADLRILGEKVIWLGVYAVVWVPLLLLAYLAWRVFFRKKPGR